VPPSTEPSLVDLRHVLPRLVELGRELLGRSCSSPERLRVGRARREEERNRAERVDVGLRRRDGLLLPALELQHAVRGQTER